MTGSRVGGAVVRWLREDRFAGRAVVLWLRDDGVESSAVVRWLWEDRAAGRAVVQWLRDDGKDTVGTSKDARSATTLTTGGIRLGP